MTRDTPAPGTDLVLGIRPEHLQPAEQGLPVTVEMAEELGGNSYVHARSATGADLVFERRGSRDRLDGQRLHLGADPQTIYAFTPDGQRLR